MHTKFHEILKPVGINVIYVGIYCETCYMSVDSCCSD